MKTETKKEERTEHVFISVSPSVKTEFDLAKDNNALKESIIRSFLTNEKDFVTQELKGIDEATVKYSAKLIGIKDAFRKTQDSYITEIEQIYESANNTFKKLDTIAVQTAKNTEYAKERLSEVLKKVDQIDTYKLERLLGVIDKFKSMSKDDLELLGKLLKTD